MSLNKFTSQAVPQPYLNPRFQSLDVDGIINTYQPMFSNNGHAISGFWGGAPYSLVPLPASFTQVSSGANGVSPLGNYNMYQVDGGIQYTDITSPYFMGCATICFVSSATAVIKITIGINGVYDAAKFVQSCTASAGLVICMTIPFQFQASVANGTISIAASTTGATNMTVNSWSMTCMQLNGAPSIPALPAPIIEARRAAARRAEAKLEAPDPKSGVLDVADEMRKADEFQSRKAAILARARARAAEPAPTLAEFKESKGEPVGATPRSLVLEPEPADYDEQPESPLSVLEQEPEPVPTPAPARHAGFGRKR